MFKAKKRISEKEEVKSDLVKENHQVLEFTAFYIGLTVAKLELALERARKMERDADDLFQFWSADAEVHSKAITRIIESFSREFDNDYNTLVALKETETVSNYLKNLKN